MASYLVKWEMDIEADSYREAAEQALKVHRDPDSEAVAFTVVHQASGVSMDIDIMDCDRLEELRRSFNATGGRSIELADEIDDLACALGDCVYSYDECGRETHPKDEDEEPESLTYCYACGEVLISDPDGSPEVWVHEDRNLDIACAAIPDLEDEEPSVDTHEDWARHPHREQRDRKD